MDNRIRIPLLIVLAGISLFADIPAEYKSTVLVVRNTATPAESGTGGVGASSYVAAHYMAARGIPNANLCDISYRGDLDPHAYDAWDISFADFQTYVDAPIRACITALGYSNIRFIVTTYGVPSNVLQYGSSFEMSIDSLLSSIGTNIICRNGTLPAQACSNTYSVSATATPARIWAFEGIGAFPFNYRPLIVGRLDGPSAVIAANLVDLAIQGEAGISKRGGGTGYFDWQGTNTSPDSTMKNAYDLCVAKNFTCSLNNQSSTGHLISSAPNTLFAWGWYSGASVNNVYTFVPGAIGAQLTSYSANCIRVNCTGSYAPYWLTAGITFFWGTTGEPTSALFPFGDNLLNHIWLGYTAGEAAYMSSTVLNWMQVFIGDPLYAPYFQGPTSFTNRVTTTGRVTLQ